MINQNHLSHCFVTKASDNKNNLKFKKMTFIKLQKKKINDSKCY